ncbi:response regulator [Xylophilus sp. GOD-11R]|uniref:response regulator n=1 Tax=Xylophilus sp. GOD-11R TaxID=3089814 RepID=UPI00298CA9BD|nr:response regulator [Xylophilus sp. GOD-11R]WPB58801.1 response regulator [Xylophilus sp. GOD-11R]
MTLRTYLIEDDADARDTLAALLQQQVPGMEIVGWGDNERSVTHWLSSNDRGWDLAIVDLQLREGSGYAALSWCGTRLPEQRVVVLSAMVSDEVRQRCLDARADAVFDKSSEIAELVAFCQALALTPDRVFPGG